MTGDIESLPFPDGPKGRMDVLIAQLVDSAHEVLATQGRLRNLVKASRVVADELELPVVLRRIVEAAVELVGCRFGAIGVIAPDGTLEQFIHVGMPPDLVESIGELPTGRGVLGALIQDQQPIRLHHLSADSRSSGFPAGHPPMDSFLGVPVRVRGEVYGNLYLTDREGGPFSDEDQQLLAALADTAGAAIDHARLYEESERRRRWSTASAEITAALLAADSTDAMSLLAERVAQLADADLVCVIVPAGSGRLRVEMARGALHQHFTGTVFDAEGTLAASAITSRQPVLSDLVVASAVDPLLSVGPTMAMPLTTTDEPLGVLTVSRVPGRARFTTVDLDMAAEFASQAGLALRLNSARLAAETLSLLEDRGRIARDLHDNVIQRLFGAGLSLQALSGSLPQGVARQRLEQQVEVLDLAIADIRTAVFAITTPAASRPGSLRHRVLDVIADASAALAESPQVIFAGAVDLMVPSVVADDVVAVVREGLSNVARHANATRVQVSVTLSDSAISVVIEDDGVGPAPGKRRSGTANLAVRAATHGGDFSLTPRDPSGSTLRWSAPIEGGDE